MPIWSQEAFVSTLGLSLLHSLWQGALLGVVGLTLQRRLKHAAPELRCGIFSLLQLTFFVVWLGTFVSLYRVAIRPMASAVDTMTGPITIAPQAFSPTLGGTSALLHLPQSLFTALVAAWALGVCVLSLRHLGGLLLLYRLTSTQTIPCLPAWEACAERLAVQMGIGRKILLRCSAQIEVPCAFGLFKSYVLLPASAMMGLTPGQAEALIAHELAHIARHDVFFNLVQVCMETILFYHPVVWWLSMQIRVAREQSCDDLAVQIIGDRALYARSLYALEEARAAIPQLALGAKGDPSRMTNRHLIHRIQRVLGVSGPEKRDPWAKGALALCAAAIGLATLMPLRAYSRPTQQDPPSKQETTVKVVTKILVNINDDKIELNTTDLKPDTPVTVNGKQGRFGDLTPKQQEELQQALKKIQVPAVPFGDGQQTMKVFVQKVDGSDSAGTSKFTIVKSGVTKILLNINGDKIELNTTDLKPDTLVKVNDKEGRFGDLTPQQQKELRQALKKVHVTSVHVGDGQHNVKVLMRDGADANGADFSKVTVSDGGVMKILLNINGDKIELNTTNLTPDTPVTVNGKQGRFGDLTPKQQQELQQAIQKVQIHVGPDATTLGLHKGLAFASATIEGGKPKIRLNIDGDTIEITGNTSDFSTENLPEDTLVKVNGKEGRFGDLTPKQQELIRATKASVHVAPATDTKQTAPPPPDKP
jgi:beta-lactamase regulating signal transducer with metallopeptidase domain